MEGGGRYVEGRNDVVGREGGRGVLYFVRREANFFWWVSRCFLCKKTSWR